MTTGGTARQRASFHRARSAAIAALFCVSVVTNVVRAQEAKPTGDAATTAAQQDVAVRSLPLRTALHHDPSLDAPFDRLVAMYREAGRSAELVELYRTHTANYPNDPNGAAVYVRLLDANADTQAATAAKSSADAHPQNAYLQYLLSRAQRKLRRTDGMPALEQAIALTTSLRQKAAWTDELLTIASGNDQPELVDKYLGDAAVAATTAEAKLEVARRLVNFSRHQPALKILEEAVKLSPTPEVGVQIETTAATVEVALDQHAAAAARLDRLLDRLAPDYWGRADLVRRRMALVTSEAERTQMVDAARKRVTDRPADEAAVADLVQLLINFERRREALTALLEAGRKIPASERLEKMTLELLDRLRDEPARRAYLAERVKASPERVDLLTLHIRALLAVGDRTTARAQIDRLVEAAPPERREQVQVELARSLLRSSLHVDATELFERVLKASPQRFDLRRELAEAYVKLGNRNRARELFSGDLPTDVATETVMDFVPFLIAQEMYVEARKALRSVIQPDDADLDLRLLAADVERRIGNRNAADKLLTEARAMADTLARYKAWIAAAAALHEEDETLGKFLQEEQQRLAAESGGWTDARLERVAALIEIAGREKAGVDLESFVAEYLEDETIPEMGRRAIRRQLVRTMKAGDDGIDALAGQLRELIDEVPDDADEYRARLALLHLKANQHHLVTPLLNEVRVARLSDVQLLQDLESAFGQMQMTEQLSAVLERLTLLDSSNKTHWEAWLYQAAVTGREDRLRDSLVRLRAGIDGLALDESVKDLLAAAELDSFGRSILTQLSDGRVGALSEALSLADAAERKAATPQQALWLTWNRAFTLNRLRRPAERDEAIAEMERLLKSLHAAATVDPGDLKAATPTDKSASEPKAGLVTAFNVDAADALQLRFADGLSLSLDSARRLLIAPPRAPFGPRPDDRRGPLPQLSTEWALDLPAGRSVESLHLLSLQRLVVVDSTGALLGVDAATGKVLWENPGFMPRVPGEFSMSMTHTLRGVSTSKSARVTAPTAMPVVDDQHRIFFAHGGEVTCVSAHDGAILWRSSMSSREGVSPVAVSGMRAPNSIFLYGEEVLAFDPEHDLVAMFDRVTGKLRWSYEISQGEPLAAIRSLNFMNTGAAYDGERLFVYGRRAAMIDVAARDVQWTIDPERASKLPLRLDPAPPTTVGPATSMVGTPSYGRPTISSISLGSSSAPYVRSYPGSSYSSGYAPPVGLPASTSSPGVVGVGNTRYVDFQRRSESAASSTTPRTPVDTTLVGPAALWAAASVSGQARCAILNDTKLLLGTNDSATIMDTDFPIAGRRLNMIGTYVGRVGNLLCSLRGNEFSVIDPATGTRGGLRLTAITGDQYNARTQVAIDGPLAYITGPQGILCFNVLSKRRVFHSAWPAGAELDADDPRLPLDAGTVDQETHYLWHGVVVPAGAISRSVSPHAAVSRGKLFVAATPWRVVCVKGIDEP